MSSVEPVGTSAAAGSNLEALGEYLALTEVFKQAMQPPPIDDADGDSSAVSDQINQAIATEIAGAVTGFGT